MSYGIPSEALPVDPTGDLRPQLWKDWVPQQREFEARIAAGDGDVDNNNNTDPAAGASTTVESVLSKLSPSYKPQSFDVDIAIPAKDGSEDSAMATTVKDGVILDPGRFDVVSALYHLSLPFCAEDLHLTIVFAVHN